MRTLYLDCTMGAAGDMLMGALLDLLEDKEAFLRGLRSVLPQHMQIEARNTQRAGIRGLRVRVFIDGEEEHQGAVPHHHHSHRTYGEIAQILSELPVSQWTKEKADAVYRALARAESEAHGVAVEQIHFHEIGTWDAVADIVGVCMLIEQLRPERILSSSVCVGSGTVPCAHGEMPVPAPATARLLTGIPSFAGDLSGERCTPTGAALLKEFAEDFSPMPLLNTQKIGYGLGSREDMGLNCVRAFLGETAQTAQTDELCELRCNLDDMTGEDIAFACEMLLESGALDVFTQSIIMKKGRPAVLLTVLCRREQTPEMQQLLFTHTTTLGVRIFPCQRVALARTERVTQTPLGEIRVKRAEGLGVTREKAEYEDLAGIAREKHLPIAEVRKQVPTDGKAP